MSERLPPDQAARTRAVTDFATNLVVTAGAGSGKTTLLVERVLNACLGRGVPLSKLTALTFTEKAAAELRERLAGALSGVLLALRADGPPASGAAGRSLAWVLAPEGGGAGVERTVVRARALKALDDIEGGGIGTIHAWCADVLRRHPREARLDPAFTVDDGMQFERVADEEWAAFLRREMAAGSPRAAAWSAFLARADVGVVRAVGEHLARDGVRELPPPVRDPLQVVQERARELRGLVHELAPTCTNRNVPSWVARTDALVDALLEGAVPGVKAALAGDPSYATASLPNAGTGCAEPEAVKQCFGAVRKLLVEVASADEDLSTRAVELSMPYREAVLERMEREGAVGFQGLLTGARELLLRHPHVRAAEQSRLESLLLDEFQDTDPLQYEIAFLLTEDPARAMPVTGDPWTARLRPGALFIVGDPKQSIYRFRNADMVSYERAVAHVVEEGGAELTLTANFRSREEVLAPINALCARAIVEEHPYQPAYVPLVAARPDARAGGTRVEVWSIDGADRNAAERRDGEAAALARELRRWSGDGTIAGWGEVTILLRAMTDVTRYQRALSEAAIPHVTYGGRGFVTRDEVVLAVTLLRALLRPHDAVAIAAVLRSPLCGASDLELWRYAEATKAHWTWRGASKQEAHVEAAAPHVVATLRELERLARRVEAMPADEALRALLDDPREGEGVRLLEAQAASLGGAQRIANLEKIVARAAELVRKEGASLARVVERLSREVEQEDDEGESPLADESLAAVRIMTIHQAKGLEFPIVVMPDVARPAAGDKWVPVSVTLSDLGVALKTGRLRNLAQVVADLEERRHEEAERARLLYVALTRAKERLVIVNAASSPSQASWCRSFAEGWGYAFDSPETELLGGAVLHRRLDATPHEAVPVQAAGVEELVAALAAQDAAEAAMEAARRPRPRAPSGAGREAVEERARQREYATVEAGVEPGPDDPLAATASVERVVEDAPVSADVVDSALARAVGVAVHLALEHGRLDDAAELARLAPGAARLAARELGGDASAIETAATALLARMPGSEVARRLAKSRVIGRELPFLMSGEGGAGSDPGWQGFIDLVVEIDGRTWVVDWKTDREHDPSRHRAQLALYGRAVQRWLDLRDPPGLALAYVTDGTWVEL